MDISDEDASLDATIGYVADYEATPASARTNRDAGAFAADPLGSLAAVQDGRMARDTAAAAAAGKFFGGGGTRRAGWPGEFGRRASNLKVTGSSPMAPGSRDPPHTAGGYR